MIVVIPYNESDWQRAERLLDAIYWISLCKPIGHCVLAPNILIHAEFKLKVKIAAEVAFQSVDQIEVPVQKDATKIAAINATFRHVSHYMSQAYKDPWLWLESDNVPLKPTWMRELFKAYDAQPKRFMGRFMMAKSGMFMSRTGIYANDAFKDFEQAVSGDPPFERVANLLPRCSSTSLIHMEKWREDIALPPEVVLLNGDRSGIMVERMIEQARVKPKKTKVIA